MNPTIIYIEKRKGKMSKKLLEITEQTKELRITSVELVDIINQFREMEFEILKEKGLNKKS